MERQIFRSAALERYHDSRDRIVLPCFARAPWLAVLWSLFALLLTLTLLLWLVRLPVYASGPGVVLADVTPTGRANGVSMAVFLPPTTANVLQVGQSVLIKLSGQSAEAVGRVVAVDGQPLSPATVRTRYGLDPSSGLLVDTPTIIALVEVEPLARVWASEWAGAVGTVQIETGTQRSLALLPGLGRGLANPASPGVGE